MREALKVNRKEMILLHSPFGFDIVFCLGFFAKAMAHVLLYSLVLYLLLLDFLTGLLLASWCA